MKLATTHNGTADGELIVVSKDLTQAVSAKNIAPNLQHALENWPSLEPGLQALYQQLNKGIASGAFDFTPLEALAPLPRAWQWLDGSAYKSHADLMSKVFGIDPISTERPLMYQGISDCFYGPGADIPFPSEDDGIDFEGEFGIITDAVPMGVSGSQAMSHIKLIVQINDWSLRKIAPVEMKTGFGWVQAKPSCSVSAVAITPDELGDAWRDGRVDLPLKVFWNDKQFGAAEGYPMAFGFHELVAHAAYSRPLVPGTIIGSGTVSNDNYREVGSSCIAERRGIELMDEGEPKTPFMNFGDRVRMEATAKDGSALFGPLDQKVIKA